RSRSIDNVMIGARSDGTAPNMAKPPGSRRGHAATVDRSRKQRRQRYDWGRTEIALSAPWETWLSKRPCSPRPLLICADLGGLASGRTSVSAGQRTRRNAPITRQFLSTAAAASVAFVDRRSIQLSYRRGRGDSRLEGRLGSALRGV